LNIGSGKITSINEIILIIKDTLNIDLNVKYIQSKEFDVDKVELSNRKLLKSLKDFEFYPLNKGIKDQFQYLLKNHGSKN
jgi:nucleoside-diphosphate-sugar epimerase